VGAKSYFPSSRNKNTLLGEKPANTKLEEEPFIQKKGGSIITKKKERRKKEGRGDNLRKDLLTAASRGKQPGMRGDKEDNYEVVPVNFKEIAMGGGKSSERKEFTKSGEKRVFELANST